MTTQAPRPSVADFKAWIKHKRVAVIGLGISNRPLLRKLVEWGADVTAFDRLEPTSPDWHAIETELRDLNLRYSLGKDYLDDLHDFNVIFRTPVMRPDHPAFIEEIARGAIFTSEMEIFMTYCPARMIAVTGSDGKTTTTTLIAELLRRAGYTVHLGGNIGRPLLPEIETIAADDIAVLELSSFQLSSMRVSPEVAVITNISPNHLDVHKDFEEYYLCKRRLIENQKITDIAVLNGHDEILRSFITETKGEVIWFNEKPADHRELFAVTDEGIVREREGERDALILRDEAIAIPGRFNRENYAAAIAAVSRLIDLDNPVIGELAETFGGVKHRLQRVGSLNGVDFYNSSIDSSPQRSKASLSVFIEHKRPLILITGGKDKNCDYSELGAAILDATERIIFCGANQALIRNSLLTEASARGIDAADLTLIDATDYADALAKAEPLMRAGDAVLLSPAGTSFDRYHNFEERGRDFETEVTAFIERRSS